ncbi:MAG: alpha/beta fold hydrolase [Pseudomonadota bacterium]
MKDDSRLFASSEETLEDNYPKLYMPYMRSMKNGMFDVDDNTQLHYRYAVPKNAIATILLMPGRAESTIKYAELCYQLAHSGYAIFIYDHRGQGLSTRPASNPQIGHVDRFTDYLDDAISIAETLVHKLIGSRLPMHLLAHSMGSAIAAGMLIKLNDVFKSAVLCSPMMGINASIPAVVGSVLAEAGLLKEKMTGVSPRFFVGQSEFVSKPFQGNKLTSSIIRHNLFMQTHSNDASLQLGGIGNRWLLEALKLMNYVLTDAYRINVPITILRATEDKVVDNAAIKRVSHRITQCKLIDIKGARHEILFEKDAIRNIALSHILEAF